MSFFLGNQRQGGESVHERASHQRAGFRERSQQM